jgi:hypothetical protein
MSQVLKHSLYSVLSTAVAFGVLATAASAQEPTTPAAPAIGAPAQVAMCSGTSTPAEIPAGEAAFRLNIALSSGIGAISAVEAPAESGLVLASPEDIPRAELANATEPAKPIELAADNNSATVWLKSADAKPGEVELTLKGESGTCTTKVTVK